VLDMVTTRRQRGTAAPRGGGDGDARKDRPEAGGNRQRRTARASVQVWSENPDKAWAERWFLAYSPVWPALFGMWCMSGWHLLVGDLGNLAVTLLIASPNVVVPALFCPSKMPWYQTYWFKFSLWIWIFSFMASYFFTEYFFDVLGMVYKFPHLTWNLDAVLLGAGKQVVPVMMYFHAWYFFITYHTCSVIFIRMIRTAPGFRDWPLLANVFSIAFSACLFAGGEIFGTTLEAIKDQFTYQNMDWALTWGTLCYSCYFIASFPMVFPMDETKTTSWSLERTIESSLAASMLAFLLLDIVAQFVITDWKNFKFHEQV